MAWNYLGGNLSPKKQQYCENNDKDGFAIPSVSQKRKSFRQLNIADINESSPSQLVTKSDCEEDMSFIVNSEMDMSSDDVQRGSLLMQIESDDSPMEDEENEF